MKVKNLIEQLNKCDPDAVVVFHENLECDGLIDFEFSPVKHVTPGFAMNQWMAGGDNEIMVYESAGVHSQGHCISTPVVALSHSALKPTPTNASVRHLSGRDWAAATEGGTNGQ